jgi:uncharacterized protein YqgV (UPF0045/DUF77 family)
MQITVEISLYPLEEGFAGVVNDFLGRLKEHPEVDVQTASMSTMISGDYEKVMDLLDREIKPVFEEHAAVFTLKIANACGV